MTQEAQEPESKRDTVSAAVTAGEKWQIQLVVRKEKKSVSELLREYNLKEIIELGARIEAALDALTTEEASV